MHYAIIIAADVSTDLTDYIKVTGPTLFAVYVLMSLIKPYLEIWLPPNRPLHDPTLRALAVIFGMLIVVIATALLSTPQNPFTGQVLFLALMQGAAAGLAAIGTYHLVGSQPDLVRSLGRRSPPTPNADGAERKDDTPAGKVPG